VLKGRLDPVTIFDLNDAKQELRRRGKVPPAKDQEMSERDYLEACIQVTNTAPLFFFFLSLSLDDSPPSRLFDPLTELTAVA